MHAVASLLSRTCENINDDEQNVSKATVEVLVLIVSESLSLRCGMAGYSSLNAMNQ
jgi:hypothetical protein